MTNTVRSIPALGLLLLGACGAPAKPSEPTQHETRIAPTETVQTGRVRWFGALHAIMHEGRTDAAVRLAEVVPGPHAWGLGALAGLHGEVTVLEDVAWLARPRADGTAVVRTAALAGEDSEQGAALLVVSNVDRWEEISVQTDVSSDTLDDFVADLLRDRGRRLDVPVAIRVEGPVAKLAWHVVDGSKLTPGGGHADHARTAVRDQVEHTNARLIGFFSTAHQGIFTHAGSHLHMHVVLDAPARSGHVDNVELTRGARFLLAAP